MRTEEPCGTLRHGREVTGPYATTWTSRYQGRFLVTCADSGRRLVILASDGSDWRESDLPLPAWEHVSVSLRDDPRKTPTWTEMCWVKSLFWDDEEVVLQFHPAASAYVNFHPGCLHLWRPIGAEVLAPPAICVGPAAEGKREAIKKEA